MAVNLTGIELNGPTLGQARKTSTSSGGASSGAQENQADSGEVQITSTAALLAQLEQSLARQPAVDANRVAALSQAIASGRYQVVPEQVASGLIGAERSLAALPLAEI
ncbi:MAG TPA: flagellar biosynthesis anti-sigma factor FlgM [Steroidobacteraceae bacterium]|nr:flagellar biosynthesis anti-sigma factor FlgM [Steroidobacteraceae bacterium]